MATLSYSSIVDDTFARQSTAFYLNQSAGNTGLVPGTPTTKGIKNNWISAAPQNLSRVLIAPNPVSGSANYFQGGGNSGFSGSLGISACAVYRGSPEWTRDVAAEMWMNNTAFAQFGMCFRASGEVSQLQYFAFYYDGTNIYFGFVVAGIFTSINSVALASGSLTYSNLLVAVAQVYDCNSTFPNFTYNFQLFYQTGGSNVYSGNPASPGTPIATLSGTYSYATPSPPQYNLADCGGFGMLVGHDTVTVSHYKAYSINAGLVATPAVNLVAGLSSATINLTNSGTTPWTVGSTTTFQVGNCNGQTNTDLTRSQGSVVSQLVTSTTAATLVINTGVTVSSFLITDTVNSVSTAVFVNPSQVVTLATLGDSRQAFAYGSNPSVIVASTTTAVQANYYQRNAYCARFLELFTAFFFPGTGGIEARPNGTAIGGTTPKLYWPPSKQIVNFTLTSAVSAGSSVSVSYTTNSNTDTVNGSISGYTGMAVTVGYGTANAETVYVLPLTTSSTLIANLANNHASGELITGASSVYQSVIQLSPDILITSTGINEYQNTSTGFASDWNTMMYNDTAHGGSGANDGLYYTLATGGSAGTGTKFVVPLIDVNNYAGQRAAAVTTFLNPFLASVPDGLRIFGGTSQAVMYQYIARMKSLYYTDGLHELGNGMMMAGAIDALLTQQALFPVPAPPINPTPTGKIIFQGH